MEPAPTRPPNPVVFKPLSPRRQHPFNTHHHPLSLSSRRKSFCFLCSHRQSQLGRPGLLGWGSFFVCTHGVRVRARECMCKRLIASFRLSCLRCSLEDFGISPWPSLVLSSLCRVQGSASGLQFITQAPTQAGSPRCPRNRPSRALPVGFHPGASLSRAGQFERCQQTPGTRTPASGSRWENLLARKKSSQRTGLPPQRPSYPGPRAQEAQRGSQKERVARDAQSLGYSPAPRSPARPPTRSAGAQPPCRAC